MINEELLGAYLEGNLSDSEAQYVETELALDPDLQGLADEVYAYVDEPAPYELELDDIDLPTIEIDNVDVEFDDILLEDEPYVIDWGDDDLDDTDSSDISDFGLDI